jgi:hypothetical protein
VSTFAFEALGITQAKRRFNRLGAAAVDLVEAWADMLAYFFWMEDATFTSQGRRGGGSWADDSEDWLVRKAREGMDPRINFATWALYDSMTELGAEGQIIEMTPNTLKLGSALPEAGPSQRFRTFIKPTEQDRFAMGNIIKNHFVRAWENA